MWRKEAEVVELYDFTDCYCLKLKDEIGFIIEREHLNGTQIKKGDMVQVDYEKGEIQSVKINGTEYPCPSRQEKKRNTFNAEKAYRELPPVLQSKMDELRARGDKNISSRDHLFLEAFTFGAQIANKFKTIKNIREFHAMDRASQKKIFPFLTYATENNYITASCYAALFVVRDNLLRAQKQSTDKNLSI